LKISSLLIILLILSCAPSPRYNNNEVNWKYKDTKDTFYGISSYYGLNDGFDGNLTANGEIFDKDGISAAHKTLPLNSIVKVTNLSNGKSLTLRINDRGPYIDGRILDCSYGAALELDFVQEGTTEIKVKVIKWGDNVYKKQN
jgi:rare lipoprotein A|tara:strand:- start:825 stop:1253 length:429 start_codon:yes stop_codon:yes gene_type:complete